MTPFDDFASEPPPPIFSVKWEHEQPPGRGDEELERDEGGRGDGFLVGE